MWAFGRKAKGAVLIIDEPGSSPTRHKLCKPDKAYKKESMLCVQAVASNSGADNERV